MFQAKDKASIVMRAYLFCEHTIKTVGNGEIECCRLSLRKLHFTTLSVQKKLAMTFTVILGLWMLSTGIGKLMVGDEIIAAFHRWAVPRWMIVPVGIAEVAAAITLFIPKTRRFSLAGIVLLMAGAIVVHIRAGEHFQVLIPAIVVALVVAIAILRYRISSTEERQD